jgi:hypothetical protein
MTLRCYNPSASVYRTQNTGAHPYWVLESSTFVCIVSSRVHPEDGGSTDLWNVGILPQHYTTSQPRRPRSEISPWRWRQHGPPSTALGYGLDNWGFESQNGVGIFLLTNASRLALGPTQWVPGDLSQGLKRWGREADHSPPSSAEVNNACYYTSTPPVRLHGMVLS